MSAAESRKQRQAALEERKRRIAELREQRSRRQEDTARVQASATANLDDYVTGLLNEPPPVAVAPSVETTAPATAVQQPAALDTGATTADASTGATAAAATPDNVVAQAVAPAPSPVKKAETFAVGTQTVATDFVEPPENEQAEKDDDEQKTKEEDAAKSDGAAVNEADKQASENADAEQAHPKVLSTDQMEKEVSSAPFSTFINTASKKVERVLGTPLLSDLLVDTVGDDGAAAAASAFADGAGKTTSSSDDAKFIAARQVYECPKWTAGRDITDIDWSPLHRELVLSTHHIKAAGASSSSSAGAAISAISPHDTPSASLTPRSGELQSDGLALVWSLAMPSRPEHVFTCGSPVTAGRFHPTDSTLVVGGCESGQVVVWDVRAGRLPVQKSALTSTVSSNSNAAGHVHPISTMAVLEGGAGFVTSSTDGKVNFWSLSNLREPAESLQLPSDSVSCFAVAPESETLVLGDENGALYAAASPSSGGAGGAGSSSSGQTSRRRQVRKLQANAEEDAAAESNDTAAAGGSSSGGGQHYGLVTALSTKKLKKTAASRTAGLSPKGFLRGSGGLVLSAGVDWTVKLWAPAYRDAPLTSLVSHSYDYMSDVQWSPQNPALFATASSNGTVGLWNLATSLDTPLTGPQGIVVEPADSSGIAQQQQQQLRGLNKLRWSLDGRRLAVAASDRLHMLTLTPAAIRTTDADADAKTMMNALMARGWISRQ